MRYRAPSGHHYFAARGGSGAALLLLHGFSGDQSTWRRLLPALQRGYHVIALDMLGHGCSDAPADCDSYRMEAVAQDILALLEGWGGVRCHLLGYSMGGRLALYLALSAPARFLSLTLESASPGLATAAERAARQQQDALLADNIQTRGIDWFLAHWQSLPLWASQAALPAEVLAAQRSQRRRNRPMGLANSLRGMGSGTQPNLWRELPRLQLPAQLIVGEADAKFRRINRAMAARLPHCQLNELPALGHNCHLEAPEVFLQAILGFLQRVTSQR